MTKQNEAVIKTPVRYTFFDDREGVTGTADYHLRDANNYCFGSVETEQQAHAIAHALNSQPALIAAALEVYAHAPYDGGSDKFYAALDQLRSAIQGAKEL